MLRPKEKNEYLKPLLEINPNNIVGEARAVKID